MSEQQGSFFQDFVDNSEERLGRALQTRLGRVVFQHIKEEIEEKMMDILYRKRVVTDRLLSQVVPDAREADLLHLTMFKHAVDQVLGARAMQKDGLHPEIAQQPHSSEIN